MLRRSLFGTHAAIAACVLALSLSACGSGSGGSAGTGPSGSSGGSFSKEKLAKRLDQDYRGTFKKLPASGPKGVHGKTVAIIPLTQLSPTFSAFTREAVAAAHSLGWKTFVIDGKLNAEGYNNAIRQATSQHPDAILLSGINCTPVKQAVLNAKSAGIKIYSVYGEDCPTHLWDGVQPVDLSGAARMRADWVASKVGPNGKVAEMYLTDDPVTVRLQNQTETALKQVCPGCEIARINWTLSDLGEPLKGKMQTGLLRNPDAKAFIGSFDAAMLFGGGAAVQGSGLTLAVMGLECAAPNLPSIRQGSQQNACTGWPFSIFGWSGIDGLNRIFAGQKSVQAGLGVQLVDKDHNLPPAGQGFLGPLTNFREHYKALWGVQ